MLDILFIFNTNMKKTYIFYCYYNATSTPKVTKVLPDELLEALLKLLLPPSVLPSGIPERKPCPKLRQSPRRNL